MQSVRDILEVFGAIDSAISSSQDRGLSTAADALIPGASANSGWYQTLQRYLFPGDKPTAPDLPAALDRISEATATENGLTQSQKVRLLYGISALARLSSVAPGSALPSFENPDDTFGAALSGALAAVVPGQPKSENSKTEDQRARNQRAKVQKTDDRETAHKKAREDAVKTAPEFLADVSSTFQRWQDFDAVRNLATTKLRSGKDLAAPMCRTAIITVDGLESVQIDTKFTSTKVSLERLKTIVNPFNWDEDYPEFFLDMDEQRQPHILPDGWRRVLERVRLVESVELLTPLKFFPYQDPERPFEASLEYDLDKSAFDTGDGKVLVDRGYIRMTATDPQQPDQPGVQVTTRKIVHIKGIPPWVQARLVCICGYGTSSADFLLKAVDQNRDDAHEFLFPTSNTEADNDPTEAIAAAPTIHFVPAAVQAWTETAGDVMNSYVGLAEKWLAGGLTMSDVTDTYRKIGADLAAAPLEYLRTMTTPRPPGGTGGSQ